MTWDLRRRDDDEDRLGAHGGDEEEPATSYVSERRRIDPALAARMRQHVGADVSHARIATGPRSDDAVRALGANAFTAGSDIVMRTGAYRPGTPSGDRLLAHELAHVAQPTAQGSTGRADASAEREADERGASAIRGSLGEPPSFVPRPTRSRRGLALDSCFSSESAQDRATRLVVPPATRADSKKLAKGTMTWKLEAKGNSSASMSITFDPVPGVAASASAISFVQLVKDRSQMGDFGGGPAYKTSKGFSVDLVVDPSSQGFTEMDPFYGAKHGKGGAWEAETASSRPWLAKDPKKAPAGLLDEPSFNMAMGERKDFETVAVVPATGEVLGSLVWGFEFPKDKPRVFHGATAADCTEAPSSQYGEALEKYHAAHFAVTVDDFAPGKADLTPAHVKLLDAAVPAVKDKRAIVAGFAEPGEDKPDVLSAARAKAVADHLAAKGVTTEVRSYGANWARVPTAAGASGKNRRVQVQAVAAAPKGQPETPVH